MGCGLLVCLFSIVVGVCVGLNPHISHCRCAPARALVHVGHGAEVCVGVVCVVVVPHTFWGLPTISMEGGSTGSSSIFEIASKTFSDGDVDEGGGCGVGEDGAGVGVFFFFFSFLYMRVGLV